MAPGRWAAARDELRGPPGVAGRLHQTPRGAAARDASCAGPARPAGRSGSPRAGPAPTRAAGSTAASSSPPACGLLTCASSPPAPRRPPLRAARRGAARPDPGLAARRSDGYETCSLRPFRSHRLPFLARAARATAAARPIGAATCGRRALPSQWAAPPANHGRPGRGRRALGGGVGQGGEGLAGVVGADGRWGGRPL